MKVIIDPKQILKIMQSMSVNDPYKKIMDDIDEKICKAFFGEELKEFEVEKEKSESAKGTK